MTAQELLDLNIDGYSTLKDVFNSHDREGQFGEDASGEYSAGSDPQFYLNIAQKIIDAVNAHKENSNGNQNS